MMQTWDFDKGSESKESKKANFTKFPVGITRIRVLDDAPFVRWTHWMPQFKRSVNCPGKGCPICEIRKQQKANGESYTYGMSRRFAINIYNYETGLQEIMEQGISFFEDLRDIMMDLKENGKELRDAILKVRRRGTGKDDTSYRVDIDEIEQMGKTEQEAMSTKIELAEFFKPHTPEKILRLLQVRENHAEAWNEIMSEGSDESDKQQEEIQIR